MSADRLLYHTPGSCSRIALNALEELGLPYRERSVAIMTGIQYGPDFLAINPKSKVPVLVEDGVAFTEAPVILYHLAVAHPDGGLLPLEEQGGVRLDALSDLVWVAGALHPTAARIFRPAAVSTVDPDGVRQAATAQMAAHAALVEARLAGGGWWYGDRWSITDLFVAWAFDLAAQYGFPLADFPAIAALRERTWARPSFVRAREKEIAVIARDGLTVPPGLTL